MSTCIQDPHTVKARKRHRCSFCNKVIEVGEEYASSVWVEDSIYTWRECKRCERYCSEMYADEWYGHHDEYTRELFYEFMSEHHPDVLNEWEAEDEQL